MNLDFPLTDLRAIARKIDMPLKAWAGNCHAVASRIWKEFPIEGATVVRGHWRGPISDRSVFKGRPFTAHSWIGLSDGRILDPTRFAFAADKPAIWLGRTDHYDLAGLWMHAGRPVPAPSGKTYRLTPAQRRALCHPAILPRNNAITSTELGWLAHRPGHEFRDHREALAAILSLGADSLVPIDLRDAILSPAHAEPGPDGFYRLPEAEAVSDTAALHQLFTRYANPDRDRRIETWAEDAGYELEDLVGAIDRLGGMALPSLAAIRADDANLLASLAAEFLGNGNAREIEAFVAAEGIGRVRLDNLLKGLGKRAGFSLSWE